MSFLNFKFHNYATQVKSLIYVYFLCRFVFVFLSLFFCPLLSKYSHITMIRRCRAYALPTTVFTLVSQLSRDNINLSFLETLVWKWYPMKIFELRTPQVGFSHEYYTYLYLFSAASLYNSLEEAAGNEKVLIWKILSIKPLTLFSVYIV